MNSSGRFMLMLVLASTPCVVHGQTADESRWQDSGWSFRIAPYLWGTATEGRFAHQRLPFTLHGSKSLGDNLEDLELGGMGMFEARRGRYGFLADGQYSRSASSLNAALGGVALPVSLKTQHSSVLLAVSYGLHEDKATTVALVAGMRIWQVRLHMAYDAPVPTPPPIPQRYVDGQKQRWVDGQIGIKARHVFPSQAFIGGWALAGAGESKLSTDLALVAGYRVNDQISLTGGYRWLSTDYTTGSGFAFDAHMQGPGIGLEYTF